MEGTIKHIKKGFLKSKELYLDTVRYWEEHILNLLGSHNDEYRNWLNTSARNGELVIDGNPIYSLIKNDSSKALRIVQDEPRSKKPYMQAWTEIFDKGKDGDNIPVLVISLELSNKTLMESLNLVEHWFVNYEKNKFNRLLESVNKKYENNYVPSAKETAWELNENLLKKEPVSMRGFGNLIIKKRASKIERNITKSIAIKLPAHTIPAFKPAKKFSAKVKKTKKLLNLQKEKMP